MAKKILIGVLLAVCLCALNTQADTVANETLLFSFIHMSDNHYGGPPGNITILENAVKQINSSFPLPAFVLITGDDVGWAKPVTRNDYEHYKRILQNFKIPFYTVPGNHDDKDFFKNVLGPLYFSFNYKNCRFIGLDDIGHYIWDPDRPNYLKLIGIIDPEQFDWLEQDLKTASKRAPPYKYIFLFTHIPVNILNNPEDEGKLYSFIHKYKVNAIFAGHVHSAGEWTKTLDDNYQFTIYTATATCEPCEQYSLVNVYSGHITVESVVISR